MNLTKSTAEAPAACPHDGDLLSAHIGGKPCVGGPARHSARSIYDLPICAWAWAEDGRDRHA